MTEGVRPQEKKAGHRGTKRIKTKENEKERDRLKGINLTGGH